MKSVIILLTIITNLLAFEPCDEDFTLLTIKGRIELGIACSTIYGRYVIYHQEDRQEIWKRWQISNQKQKSVQYATQNGPRQALEQRYGMTVNLVERPQRTSWWSNLLQSLEELESTN